MKNAKEISATGREVQVLELAAEGLTDKQIALKLEISKATVSSYWRRILLKYQAASRTEVVARHAEQKAMLRLSPSPSELEVATEVSGRTLAEAKELAQRNVLQAITECTVEFIGGRTGFSEVFERFLSELLGLSQSEHGFLAEVHRDEENKPFLRTHAVTNIAWDEASREMVSQAGDAGMEFRNLSTLFGAVVTSGEIVISNDPENDTRAGGLPTGHPAMTAFLGLPVFSGNHLIGVIGLANRPGGYQAEIAEYLSPLVATFASYLVGWQSERDRRSVEEEITNAAILTSMLVDAMPTAILFEDAKRRLQYVNRLFLEVFGAGGSPNDFLGMDCALVAELSRPMFADPDSFIQRVDELLRAGVDAAGDIVRLANGKVYERDFVVVQKSERLLGYLWKYREVTIWRSEHEMLASVFQRAMDAVIVINAAGVVEYWNSKAEGMFGYTSAESVGKMLGDLIVPLEHRESHRRGLERFLATRESRVLNQVISISGLHKSGQLLDVELLITCIEQDPEPRYSAFIRPKVAT